MTNPRLFYTLAPMKATQFELLRTGLKALPVISTLGVAFICFVLDASEVALFGNAEAGKHTIRDIIIGGTMGLLGGLAVSSLGQAALYLVKVERDPTYKDKRKGGSSSAGGPSSVFRVYDKADIQDNQKSTTKMAQKYAEKEKTAKAERSQILEMGTEGIAQKKREQLGIKSSGISKSGVSQSGVNKSGVNKSGINKPPEGKKPGTGK